ncbi:methylmalonyl Co-A mutase-associated GTPase MeaB [Dokdonia sp. Hel_I_53]|uniref:methylmalonyl Co-A mutase-associated GTPase MeaB n=1 Tax=Dokdonia sp. Hel_I_53 TaxID=1566287 RepID=UPI0011991E4A|nr:methylmalonyl Co-A mutase-associated GTPase MeaB [Dokdonia sp. Hel_I_53]TVZ51865.1 methylmalonyl-CoA mutase metallochaperone MeaB [Dokdonia sp. Hel_I_53]
MGNSENSIKKSINPKILRAHKLSIKYDITLLTQKIISGDITALSQGITLIESTASKDKTLADDLIVKCLPHSSRSTRIGITGVPGVGKSTFIEVFGLHLIDKGKKVAVLAVDPTSSLSKGSILGDKTRMYHLSQNTNAFIRPSASGDSLGGVARKTREAIILCEAAGFDTIIVETVGVGQSETVVHSMVDFFLLLKLSGAGDELQGIKRGIIEMADAIVINKADGENEKAARLAKSAFAKALHLFPPKESNWSPKVATCSALENNGIKEIYDTIDEYLSITKPSGYFDKKRANQNEFWLLQTIENKLKDDFYNHPNIVEKLPEILKKVANNELSPFIAAQQLLKFTTH